MGDLSCMRSQFTSASMGASLARGAYLRNPLLQSQRRSQSLL